jgi:MFS family permease
MGSTACSDIDMGDGDHRAAMERNLRLYPLHRVLATCLPWLAVLELYTTSRFGLRSAVTLVAVYYLSVTVLEVPTGWFSDRSGRVPTLRLAAACWMAAQLCFLLGDGRFLVVALGQVGMAGGFAALSGTDVAFHADSLEATGRLHELPWREARLTATARIAYAVAVLTGGGLGLIGLWVPFVASFILAGAQAVVASRLSEPRPLPAAGHATPAVPGRSHLGVTLGYFRQRLLAWLLIYAIALVTMEHVASTLIQPWLVVALDRDLTDLGPVPLVSGAVLAATAPVGALAARWSVSLRYRFGLVTTLLGLSVVSAVVVTGMALWLHAAALLLFALRGLQPAAARVLIESEVVARVDAAHRATVLSLQSLAGRLGYGLLLLLTASATATGADQDVRSTYGTLSMVAWILVAVTTGAAAVITLPLRRRPATAPVRVRE